MITFITGKVIKVKSEDKKYGVDVLTSAGIGYRIVLTSGGLDYKTDDNVELFTSFQVREDSQTLYGFKSEEERDFFEELIDVPGIGPKIGISVLSTFGLSELKELIAEGDFKSLSKASGLGSKGAQKIIVDMKGKFKIEDDQSDAGKESDLKIKELKDLLKRLGFRSDELEGMVEIGRDILNVNQNISIEQLLQSVLRNSK